jgi:ATP-dependent Clp protease ATP-binding subunit ClpB
VFDLLISYLPAVALNKNIFFSERLSVARDESEGSSRLAALDASIAEVKRQEEEATQKWNLEKVGVTKIQEIKNQIDATQTQIAKAQREYDLNTAAKLKYGTLPELQKKLEDEEKIYAESQQRQQNASSEEGRMLYDTVTEDHIAGIVSSWTKIPVSKLLQSEQKKLLGLQHELDKFVIGQAAATKVVAEAIQRSRAGLSDPMRPIATLAFLGPTGVGKTELCKTLARFLFDSEEAMVRIDMSEYMEKHSVSRLIGAPPGYVGFDEGGQLTEAVRRKPYSVVLFDEMEKAHPDVFNVLLQLLDDGRLTDSKGNVVNFRNTIVILTSNIGSSDLLKVDRNNTELIRNTVMHALQTKFRPEFLNRIDEFVLFNSLGQDQMRPIVNLELNKVMKRLKEKDLALNVTDTATDWLAEHGYDPVYGARPLKRTIQRELETRLAKDILAGSYPPHSTINVDAISKKDEQLTFTIKPEEQKKV